LSDVGAGNEWLMRRSVGAGYGLVGAIQAWEKKQRCKQCPSTSSR
jgi:hypothetical protein